MSNNASVNILSAILYGATFVGVVSLTLSIIGRHFPENPAKAMARLTLSYSAAQIVAPAIAGYIATSTGSFQGAMILAALVMAIGVVLLFALQREETRKAREVAVNGHRLSMLHSAKSSTLTSKTHVTKCSLIR